MKLVLLLIALLILALALLPRANALTNCSVADSSLDATEAQFVVLLNQYRVSRGLAPLSIAPSLNRAATWMAQDEQAKGYFSHTDSLGRDPFARMNQCGYFQAGGENLAMGNLPSAQAVLSAWQSSPGHNAAMLQPGFTQMGIAHYGVQWALDFGFGSEGATPTPTPKVWRVYLGPIASEP